MDQVLTLIPAAERRLVHDRVNVLCQPGVARRVGTVVAAIAPWLPHERLSPLVRYAVWTLELDDQLDRRDPDPIALRRILLDARAVARGLPAGGTLAALDDIMSALSGYDRSGAIMARFRTALHDAIAAGVHHALFGGNAPPPTAEQYLEVAARTVNYRSFAYALLAVTGGHLAPGDLDRLEPALALASRAVRLSNDLRSIARDRAESTLNILGLSHADGSPVTRRYVRREITRCLRAHQRTLLPLIETRSDLAGPLGTLARSLELSVGLYQFTDLR